MCKYHKIRRIYVEMVHLDYRKLWYNGTFFTMAAILSTADIEAVTVYHTSLGEKVFTITLAPRKLG